MYYVETGVLVGENHANVFRDRDNFLFGFAGDWEFCLQFIFSKEPQELVFLGHA